MDEIAFLKEFVAIPSPSEHEAAVADYLVTHMQALGFAAHKDDVGNAIGIVGDSGPQVFLLGHIDTVPGDIPVRIEDGILYGRGSVDAKGPFATFVCATARAAQRGTLACRVVLMGAVEEETPDSKGANYIVNHTQRPPEYCIIGEPSKWDRITLGYKGRLLAHYRHEQENAHSASAQRSAPEYAVEFWNWLSDYCAQYNQRYERLFDQLTPSLQHIRSGNDGMYDWVESTMGLRLPEGLEPYMMAPLLHDWTDQYRGSGVVCEGMCPAYRSKRSTPLANAFVRGIRTCGGTPGYVHKTGTSDMNVAGPAWQCPMVAYGPGDSQLDHTPNEHLSLDEYQQAIAVLTLVLENLGP
jgi:[amino group carrier protein]-lysine/ornithine hydrolase